MLQRNFAYTGHALIRLLKERYGVEAFCGYVYLRSSYDFLKSQTDIPYTTLLLDEDIHEQYKAEALDPAFLDHLEKTYGLPSLWPFLAVDRVLMSNQLVREYPYDQSHYTHEELLRILQVHARAVIRMLETERPDFVCCSVIGGIGSMLLVQIARTMGIKVLVLNTPCLRNRWAVSETADGFSFAEQAFRAEPDRLRTTPAWQQAVSYLEAFRAQPFVHYDKATPAMQSVTRWRQLKFLNPANALRSLIVFLRSVWQHYTRPDRHDYSYIGPWNYLWDMIQRKLRNARGLEDFYDAFTPHAEPFAFFPLHYEPETSLLLLAPYYADQLHLIRQIARSLPVQMTLYVKEHPAMVEYRPRSYYRALKKIHNVKIIPPWVSSFAITPHTALICTITSTAGWEGLLLGKPVITFGNWFYNALPMVTRCRDIETLPMLIQEQLAHPPQNDHALLTFLAALFEDTVDIDLPRLWNEEPDIEKKKEGLIPLADLLAKRLGLRSR
ncbi:MAG: hypothetical protein RL141_901 [Candidatus Parcubacteria bacterium]